MNQQNVSDLSKHPTGGLRRMLTVQGPPATQSSARRVRSEHAGDRLRPKRTFRTFTPCRLSARTSPVQSSARLRSTLPVHARLPQSHGRTPATALFVSSHPIQIVFDGLDERLPPAHAELCLPQRDFAYLSIGPKRHRSFETMYPTCRLRSILH